MALGLQRLLLQTTVLVILVLAKAFPLTGKGTSCGIVWEESNMKLTCFFPEDINETKRDFTVYLNNGGPGPITVVRCIRPPENGYYCKQNAGYEYDNVIHPSHVDIRIRNATREHFGVYECQIPGYSNTGTCSPPEKPRPQTSSSSTQKTTTTVTTEGIGLNEDLTDGRTSEDPESVTPAAGSRTDSRHQEAEIIGGSTATIVFGIIIALVCFLVRRKIKNTPRKSKDEMETETERVEGMRLINDRAPVQEQGVRSDPSDLENHESVSSDPIKHENVEYIDLTKHEGDCSVLTEHKTNPHQRIQTSSADLENGDQSEYTPGSGDSSVKEHLSPDVPVRKISAEETKDFVRESENQPENFSPSQKMQQVQQAEIPDHDQHCIEQSADLSQTLCQVR